MTAAPAKKDSRSQVRSGSRAIDLFCGAGGSSWGARDAGARLVAGFDMWGLARSHFALAAVLVALSDAAVSESELKMVREKVGAEAVFKMAARRKAAEEALATLQLTPAEAGRRAVEVLNRCLALWPDTKSQDTILADVGLLVSRFPELACEKDGKPWVVGWEAVQKPWHHLISDFAR